MKKYALVLIGIFALTLMSFNVVKKPKVKVITNGIDLSQSFVVQSIAWKNSYDKTLERKWEEQLFLNGLKTGVYSQSRRLKDTENREMEVSNQTEVEGRYLMQIVSDVKLIIRDMNSKSLVGSITFKRGGYTSLSFPMIVDPSFIDMAIKEMIQQNE